MTGWGSGSSSAAAPSATSIVRNTTNANGGAGHLRRGRGAARPRQRAHRNTASDNGSDGITRRQGRPHADRERDARQPRLGHQRRRPELHGSGNVAEGNGQVGDCLGIVCSLLDVTPPETKIDSGPDAVTSGSTAPSTFSADEPASFECCARRRRVRAVFVARRVQRARRGRPPGPGPRDRRGRQHRPDARFVRVDDRPDAARDHDLRRPGRGHGEHFGRVHVLGRQVPRRSSARSTVPRSSHVRRRPSTAISPRASTGSQVRASDRPATPTRRPRRTRGRSSRTRTSSRPRPASTAARTR